jgi:Rrf2 family iron-sulfur cluster assembly transcriptional regulator
LILYRIKRLLFILFTGLSMRLTRAGEYAVRCVLYLCGQDRGLIVPRREVAQSMEIPEQFLGKIAQQLARAGILEIVQGAKGGLRLVVAPDQVTLLDVVEAVIGEIFLNDCLLRSSSCSRVNSCAVHQVWLKARAQLRETLASATFAELLKDKVCVDPEFLAQQRLEELR